MRDKPEVPPTTLREILCVLLRLRDDEKLLKKALAFLIGLDSARH